LAEFRLRMVVAQHDKIFTGDEPLFNAMLFIANLVQQEMYRPRPSTEESENTSLRGTQRLYILTLLLWAIVGNLDNRICKAEAKPPSPLLSRLPWHNLVAHLPALHNSLGSLYEILTAEHTGEHSLRPYATLSEMRSSHHGNFLHDARIATHYIEEYRSLFEQDDEHSKTLSLHRTFSEQPVPNIYVPSCCVSHLPLLLPNIRTLWESIFKPKGWNVMWEQQGGFLFRLSSAPTIDYILCLGPTYGCTKAHAPLTFIQ